MDRKAFAFEVKEISESGVFEGIASVCGVKDLGGDIIEQGAFTKTLSEHPEVPVLWQHDSTEVIGSGQLTEDGPIIRIKGQLDMGDPMAVKALGKLKARLLKGLSIGFNAIKVTWEETKTEYIRHITELKLWEVSIVTFPMLPDAVVTSAKSVERIMHVIERAEMEKKSGRKISAATRAELQGIMGDHQTVMNGHQAVMDRIRALLADEGASTDEAAAGKEAAVDSKEPILDHSGLISGIESMLATIPQ